MDRRMTEVKREEGRKEDRKKGLKRSKGWIDG